MSAQDNFSAELAAWLDIKAEVPVPASALDRALTATSARRPRRSVVAGPASHWIQAGPVNPMPLAVRRSLGSSRLVLLALVALLAIALAGAAILVGGSTEHRPAPQALRTWPGPVQNVAAMPVRPLTRDEDGSLTWADAVDAPIDWLDITGIRASSVNLGHWSIGLAASPPQAEGLDPAQTLISYGLVFETTGDGRADYVVGISNDAPVRGDYRVWVTDLASGVTEEQVGPPYGFPVEFVHPNDATPDDPTEKPHVIFTFLGGSRPRGLTTTSRFYAWSAVTRADGTAVWDYAPDAAWLGTSLSSPVGGESGS